MVTGKDKSALGVIRLGSAKARNFSLEEKHVLELVGNRIGDTDAPADDLAGAPARQ